MAVQNKQLNPEDSNIIQNIIHKLQEWFGKSRLDLLSVAWREINLVKKGSDEKLDVFMNRFDAAYLKLKCSVSGLPDEILTIMFLDGMNLDNIQKQNIVSEVKFEDNPNLFEDVKKAVNCLKNNKARDPLGLIN